MKRLYTLMAGVATLVTLLAVAPGTASATPGFAPAAARSGPAAAAEPDRDGPAEHVELPYKAPAVAGTAGRAGSTAGSTSAAEADGWFYAYEHANFQGKWCAWEGTEKNWGNAGGGGTGGRWDCGGYYGLDNMATSVWNNGFYVPEVSAVHMHVETFYRGGRMCLDHGDYWQDFTLGWEVFNDGTPADNEISSHYWGGPCV
ncbi:hypothetical protein ACSNN9_20075 [Micromonospora sp. URMC 107]|uniref:hypothetical protein n=1 Tax=Micromonospora sp. URMC 107 TaxID=3423418 RepID=UPI003F19709C